MAGRKGDYLFKRAGSDNWCVRFVHPPDAEGRTGKTETRSLGTSDRVAAEVLARPLVEEHRARVEAAALLRAGPDRRMLDAATVVRVPGCEGRNFRQRAVEISDWMDLHAPNGGDRTGRVVVHPLLFAFSDPDLALAFKMRFG